MPGPAMHPADTDEIGVNPTIRYIIEHTGWMIWPLAWVLVGAIAHFIGHL